MNTLALPRALYVGSAALAVWVGLVLLAKYQLVEPQAFAAACDAGTGPALACLVRHAVVMGFVKNIAGMAATVLGLWCTVTRSLVLAFAALACGLFSILLYRFDAAVVGVLLALLVVFRAAAAQGPQAAAGQQQA
jgi:hypothetical protein